MVGRGYYYCGMGSLHIYKCSVTFRNFMEVFGGVFSLLIVDNPYEGWCMDQAAVTFNSTRLFFEVLIIALRRCGSMITRLRIDHV